MEKILVVEDSAFFRNLIVGGFENEPGIELVAVETLAEATAAINNTEMPFFLALLDLNLADATDGEAVDLAIEHGIPSVIFTGDFDTDVRERYLDKGVLDVVLKDNPSSLRYLINLSRRILRNRTITALVVDDSSVARRFCANLLRRYRLKVVEAANGSEALGALENDPNIRLVITDHEMPDMDGFELVTTIRRDFNRDRLAVIGVSGSGGAPLSVKFLKHGANDFITKPYLPEELYTRIALNLDMLENISALTDAATRDFLTGLLNRRSFFDIGTRLLKTAHRNGQAAAVAILDVDHFKSVNDTYGHETGDDVLKAVAQAIETHAKRGGDLCVRLGGEEFAVLLEAGNTDGATEYFEKLRKAVAEAEVDIAGSGPLRVTASIGVVFSAEGTLDQALANADENLYAAKQGGRDRVVVK